MAHSYTPPFLRLGSILVIGIGFLVMGVTSASAGQCLLSSSANEELKAYQAALKKELTEITKVATQQQCSSMTALGKNIEEDLSNTTLNNERAKANMLLSQVINEGRDLRLLETTFRYNVSRIIRYEDLPLLKRDRNSLKSLSSSIEKTTRNVFSRCAEDAQYQGTTLSKRLSKIYGDHLGVTAYFEGVASGVPGAIPTPNILLEPSQESLAKAIERDYLPKSLDSCRGEGPTMQKAIEKITKVFMQGVSIQESTQAWREAWDMLKTGSSAQKNAEQRLLSKYLSSYGISGNRKQALLKQLACKQTGQSCSASWWEPNVLGTTEVGQQITQISNQLKTIQNVTITTYKRAMGYENICGESDITAPEECLVPKTTAAILSSSDYAGQLTKIRLQSATMYQTLTRISNQTNDDNETISSIESLISTLYMTNEELLKVERKAKSACNKQLTGEGNCD